MKETKSRAIPFQRSRCAENSRSFSRTPIGSVSFRAPKGMTSSRSWRREYGLKTLVGAWVGDDEEKNEEEIERLIELARAGFVDIAAVGNEVMYRKELEESELIAYINRVKEAIPEVPVGYVDAYYEFTNRPKITEACDVILANCYPYWEGCHSDYSLLYMKQMYYQAKQAAPDKKVIITETGWPSAGDSLGCCRSRLRKRPQVFHQRAELVAKRRDRDVLLFCF